MIHGFLTSARLSFDWWVLFMNLSMELNMHNKKLQSSSTQVSTPKEHRIFLVFCSFLLNFIPLLCGFILFLLFAYDFYKFGGFRNVRMLIFLVGFIFFFTCGICRMCQKLKKLAYGCLIIFFVLASISALVVHVLDDFTAKPIIYLYPEKTTEISVKVGNPQNLTHTYPKYETGWFVTAEPNGNLTDTKTNKHYYALYWEGKNTIKPNMKEGFVVKGQDTIPFLEEKLSQLGLNEREANEFIIYWLPKLESSPYNFIRFQKIEEQNQNMPLDITPKPDTLIRVTMEFKNLVKPIVVKEQILPPTPVRTGFVAVEWGGTDIKGNLLR